MIRKPAARNDYVVNPQNVFDQCHEHLRISEQRRDIAVGVLVTFVLAVLAVLREEAERPLELGLAVTLIGIGVFAMLAQLRRWKLIHLHAASVFMLFSGDGDLPTQEEALEIWNKTVGSSSSRLRWSSIDLWLLMISVFVSGIIAVPFLAELFAIPGFRLWLGSVFAVVTWPLSSWLISWAEFLIPGLERWLGYIFAFAAWPLSAWLISSLTERTVYTFPHYAWMFRGLQRRRPQ